ncbi:hypothetical protein KLP40_20815 [Hymenobacter sp. NST-14]|uniref:hypothetical protein n=1 Tax=Hymenobacter piscis TaxID=2839984 RepID=UPI001C01DC4A|nr:hypothetical protein [Hymenobacter piscis]MBT9395621.1 hypothetical protein [Hymenobacter piscis]
MKISPSGVMCTADAVMATEDEDGATTTGAGATMMVGLGSGLEQALGAKANTMGTTALNSKSLRVVRFIEQCDFPYISPGQSSLSGFLWTAPVIGSSIVNSPLSRPKSEFREKTCRLWQHLRTSL